MRTNRFDINRMTRSNTGGGGGATGGGGGYTLPLAANGVRGGVQIGYTTSAANRNYAVQLDNEKMFVNVPWTDHYAWTDITDKPATATRWPSWDEVTSKPSFNYIPLHNIESTNGNIPTWGTLTAANGYSAGAIWSFPGGSDLAFAYKSGQVSMQVDGFFYQNEGSYKVCDVGGFAMNSGARISFNGGDGYLGNADNAGWLMVQNICSQSERGDTYWSLRTNGEAVFSKMTSKTSSKALSDARHKDVKRGVELTVEQIAAMPAVIFEWLGKELKDIDPGEHVGTLAQEWQKILPQAVSEQEDGTLTMGYGEAALVSVITLARRVLKIVRRMFKLSRHVLKLERRVSKLEKEITKLKEQKNVTE